MWALLKASHPCLGIYMDTHLDKDKPDEIPQRGTRRHLDSSVGDFTACRLAHWCNNSQSTHHVACTIETS